MKRLYLLVLSALLVLIPITFSIAQAQIVIASGSAGGFTGFESSWKTDNAGTSGDDEITLPIYNGGNYDFNVDWGDGTDDDITAWNDAAVTHTYGGGAGTYTVKITGTLDGWRFNNGGDKLKILTISSWGDLLVGNSNGYFYGCANLAISASDVLDVSGVTTMSNVFRDCTSITTFDVSSWDVSNVTAFIQAFLGCNSLTTLDVSSWDISGNPSFINAFGGCTSLTTLDVSSWNVSGVTTMQQIFDGCTALATLDVSSWNTGSVTTFAYAFRNCTSLTTPDVDGWDITSVTAMTDMFDGVTLTTVTYDALLIGWEGQAVQNNVTFDGGNSKYTGGGAAEAARTALIDDHTWTITDGGTV